jgi:N6-adenosine-specific RNA methylase IME4
LLVSPPEVEAQAPVAGGATKYGVIVADPPWNYNRAGKGGVTDTGKVYKLSGYSDHKYQPLSTEDLCGLGTAIKQISSPDALLFLWTTWPFIRDALDIIEAWGFTYVTGIPWVKMDRKLEQPTYGVGYWFRGCTEPILVAKRGKSFRGNRRGILGFEPASMLGFASPPEGHSKKPDDLQYLIESDYPGPYLELFGRRARKNWTVLGNGAPGDGMDIRDSLQALTRD